MRVFLIDDEQPSLDELVWRLRKYPDIEIAGIFTDPASALEAAEEGRLDAAFLDIDMPGLTGLELALEIQAQYPSVVVIFVTAHAQYALEAYRSFPLDFLLKPVKEARLDETIEHLRAQHKLLNRAYAPESRVRIRCFGAFELLVAEAVKWRTHRVRELFLYLIDRRGAAPTKEEMLDALFEGRSDKAAVNNLYMTIYRLRNLLSELDAEGKCVRMANDYSLIVAPGVCDYTDFMAFAQGNAVTGKNVADAARMLALCRAPYLEKEPFEWAAESAWEAEAEYERIALELAGCHTAAGRVPEAEKVLCALLARSPLSAEGYEALLDLYAGGGNRTAYCERYEQYARLMKKEFRLMPQARYKEHYERAKRAK